MTRRVRGSTFPSVHMSTHISSVTNIIFNGSLIMSTARPINSTPR